MKTILVPYDFSKYSLKALKYATGVAKKMNASLELVHVMELPVISDPLKLPVFNYDSPLKDELNEKTSKKFEAIAGQYRDDDVAISYRQLFGPVSRTILEYTNAHKFEMIIMGSHGASALSEFILGSNVMKIIRTSGTPVLVIKDQVEERVQSIVFPHSLEIEGQGELVEKVITLQNLFAAHLHIVSVNSPLAFTSDAVFKAKLDAFLHHFTFENFTSRIYRCKNYADGILEYTKSVSADLIVMGTHSRTGLSHLINDSVTENVVRQSEIPVWTSSLRNIFASAE